MKRPNVEAYMNGEGPYINAVGAAVVSSEWVEWTRKTLEESMQYILALEAALAETPENVVRVQRAIIDQDVFSRLLSAIDQWDASDPTGMTRMQDAALAIAEDTARAVLRALRGGRMDNAERWAQAWFETVPTKGDGKSCYVDEAIAMCADAIRAVCRAKGESFCPLICRGCRERTEVHHLADVEYHLDEQGNKHFCQAWVLREHAADVPPPPVGTCR